MSATFSLIHSRNPIFIAELYQELKKHDVMSSASVENISDEYHIMVDSAVKKNSIKLKQLQVGIEFFRLGWNKHRALARRIDKLEK